MADVLPTPWIIDRAVGDMKLDSQSGPQLATYVRYNAVLEQPWLKTELGVDLDQAKVRQIRKMDDPSNMTELPISGAWPRRSRCSPITCRLPSTSRKRSPSSKRKWKAAAHVRNEPSRAAKGRAFQRPYDRRAGARKAALSARRGAGRAGAIASALADLDVGASDFASAAAHAAAIFCSPRRRSRARPARALHSVRGADLPREVGRFRRGRLARTIFRGEGGADASCRASRARPAAGRRRSL